ncbi:aryl hydrocarbon receptor-like [Gigantopelta aegis]|uniref:aryl hydrocarbon receptor-like n=1 Tax=Gigantopelta aegis TaxID=1735272 RepID=UPI001B8898EA|nr:aryl hydrocarbon receptor-like [Gigantopelta aegis]
MKSEKGDSSDSKPKIDPSFKSKRYRDKLRTEIKALEVLLPVDRTVLNRKLDSQTVFRLVISYFRSKIFFKAAGFYDDEHDDSLAEDSTEPDSDKEETSNIEIIHGKSAIQVLDGFLLTLTTDGTILYVSENILQYLGYNQIDLMHRCLYGIVHPDDHYELKTILENSLPNDQLQTTSADSQCTETSCGEKADGMELCKAVSFISRMKCFSGTSAGYLKIHCSGKVMDLSEGWKNKRASSQIVFLYCHPFMLNTTELADDIRQNVFWTKHGMDLKIKEVDAKASYILGYDSDDLAGRSFYSLIHIDDVATCLACHRALMGSSEIQTIYYRIQSLKGTWVWLQSRGKVISKNCKKFSIVFSHCPVREEDSTYIQQEIVLRQRYAVNDLMSMIQFGHYKTPWKNIRETAADGAEEHVSKRHCDPQPQFNAEQDDLALSLPCQMLMPCPSSWHTLTDRHSPILPSSHVAHKISQREKQLQFQEFKRRQQLEQHCPHPGMALWEISPGRNAPQAYDVQAERGTFIPQTIGSMPGYSNMWHSMPTCRHPSENHSFNPGYYQGFSIQQHPQYGGPIPQWLPPNYSNQPFQCVQANISFLPSAQLYMYTNINVQTMPPSPPPSPLGTRQSYQHIYNTNPITCNYPSQSHQMFPNPDENRMVLAHPTPYNESPNGLPKYTLKPSCSAPISLSTNENQQASSNGCSEISHPSLHNEQKFQVVPVPVPSCAVASGSCTKPMEISSPEVELDQHMSIVEPSKSPEDREYVDLPSIGSFLEYLNEV